MYMTTYSRPVSQLVRSVLGDGFFAPEAENHSPSVNVREDKTGWYLDLELPGVDRKDVKVEIKNGMLTVSGVRTEHNETDEKGYVRRESSWSSFSRSWSIEDAVDASKVTAESKNGVLTLTLPKHEEVKKKEETRIVEIK